MAERAGGLTTDDLAWLAAQSAQLPGKVDAIPGAVSPPIPTEDKLAAQMFVPVSTDAEARVAVGKLRTALKRAPDGLKVYVTGAAGLSADLGNGFAGTDSLLLLVAVITVLVILVVV